MENYRKTSHSVYDIKYHIVWITKYRKPVIGVALKYRFMRVRMKGQHRGNIGNEGQLHIKEDNIYLLNPYELKDDNIEGAIKAAA